MSDLNLTEAQFRELYRCSSDPAYFIENFVWLEEKETQRILPFNPFPYQKKMLDWMHAGHNILSLKSRRVGCSWLTAAYAAWLINFRRGVNVLFLSKKEGDAIKLLRKVKFVLKNLAKHDNPDYMRATKTPWMCGEIHVDNQQLFTIAYRDDSGHVVAESEAASLTTTGQSGRSEGASLIFLDEFAFVKPDDESTWTAIKPTVARGGQWIQVSTPNGVGGVFHRLCLQAQRKENEKYEYIEVHWTEAGITQEQYEAAIEGMDSQAIAQEWELDFAQSGNPVFNSTDLAACYKPVDEYPEVAEQLILYRQRVGNYYSGVDSAEGNVRRKNRAKDFNSWTSLTKTGIQAGAIHNKEPISTWAGKVNTTLSGNPVVVPGITTSLHKEYPGLVKVEENGPGLMVLSMHKPPMDGFSEVYAHRTTGPSKARIINNLKVGIESHGLTITDLFTYQCLMVYQHGSQPGQFEAPAGYNDDPVITLALAYDLMIEFGDMEFRWAEGDGPRRASVSQQDRDEIEVANAPEAPNLDNMRMSEFVEGPGHLPPMPTMPIPDLSLIQDSNGDDLLGEQLKRYAREREYSVP